MTTRRALIGVILPAALLAWGCVDLGNLASEDQAGAEGCPAGQQRLDGRCVEAPPSQPPNSDGQCAEGLQDNDKNALCEASCTSAKLGCTLHSRCDDSTGKASCVCAMGYVREAEVDRLTECVWRGGPRDPGFQNSPAAWEVGGGTLDPTAASAVDPGRVRFSGAAVCSGAGFARQAFPMPAFAEAEPFALDIQGAQTLSDEETGGIAFSIGGAYVGGAAFSGGKVHTCLGDRAYGGNVDLRINAASTGCDATSVLDIDRVTVGPSPECPVPGRVVNGDFEGTGGWVVSGMGAEVATGVGTGAGRGGHLSTTNLCQEPSIAGSMSAPSIGLPRPALAFSYKGTIGKKMLVSAGVGSTLGEVTGNATFQAARLCVPEWAKGVVTPLRFLLDDVGGLCADPNVRDFTFDDLSFVSDPSCPVAANVVDGSFESSTAEASPWILAHDTQYSTDASIVRRSPEDAHSGSAYLSLYTSQVCHFGRAQQTITVPLPAGAAGPAVKLWYRLPKKVTASFTVTAGKAASAALAVAATWTQKIVCLRPVDAGQPVGFGITASGGSGTCANTFSGETLDVDDIEVTTDPSCPAK